ncbi:Formate--tetrahydrofolate ligase [Marinomonas gallaica]|uniref:Formate--tetrahydrofolate ligase n=1 Tax=Marinomonas gallaica TaxID=1806667 RepID=A0A1C3JVW1_9GAMM|nr:formate--tetrahydrofolate ligase [Marinomonas gallaica]SBT19333.1 Formate--tetrahydrofolate ligase [Marinomonas gallaica]SBT22843.1 Formate--tetrahydrofolate ligase [Marinomonas gallaica]
MNDIDIAQAASLQPIRHIAEKLGMPESALQPFGHHKAKVDLTYLKTLEHKPDGKLILVTGITPTPAGEGKTTTTVGLTDALNRLGHNASACLREPSLGPCFGMKGGAAGGGYAQVVPMEDINLHFTGDFHAISTAHNLLSALIDNHIHWGNELEFDQRRIVWRRVMDMNDRALRQITCGLGGPNNGFPRQDGFDITVASEVMAIFCLARDLKDLEQRLGNIVVGYRRDETPITAKELKAPGPMSVLLKEALAPNLVQTLEHNPAFVHGGPFANIAHGCNSVIATRAALKLSDYVITEAGFGADLGAEKFIDIKCRSAGLNPDVAIIVATVRALKMHGGVNKEALDTKNIDAVRSGCDNLIRHIENMKQFDVPVLVAVNRFSTDSDAELELIRDIAKFHGVSAEICSHWSDGGAGTEALAQQVVDLTQTEQPLCQPLYNNNLSLWDKVHTLATRLYRADDITADQKTRDHLKMLEGAGYGHLPVCIAKTQYSFSTDPSLKGAPSGHVVPIREVHLSAGAGFVVVVCGDIMTMPGLPREPAANRIRLNEQGNIEGLF